MSDSESESTDGDNNNARSSFFDHYLRGNRIAPYEYDDNRDLDDDDSSSDFDILDQFVNFRPSTSNVRFLILLIRFFILIVSYFRLKRYYIIHLMNQILNLTPHLIVQKVLFLIYS